MSDRTKRRSTKGLPDPEGVRRARSALMARIRSKNTRPELAVRRLLHAWGYRFRLHRKDLPGKPDIVISRLKLALFVQGCFWHQHPGCKLASRPKSREEYWGPKLAGNVERDASAQRALADLGWNVAIIWECDVRRTEVLPEILRDIVAAAEGSKPLRGRSPA